MSAPTIRVVPAARLDRDDVARWCELQDADPALASPYFSPDFTLRVADVRPEVFVAVMESAGVPVGFFPYQRRGHSGVAVGVRLNHHEGVILDHGIELHPLALIRACGLRDWQFNMLPVSQTAFVPFQRVIWSAPYIDLSSGYDAYIAAHNERHSAKRLATLARRQRKIEREIGPLRLDFGTDASDVFETIIQLKAAQFRHHNNLHDPSYLALLRHLHAAPTPRCTLTVSALYAGDRFVAGEISLGSASMLSLIVTAYDPELAVYSPGSLLVTRVCEAAATRGITKYDLGRGEEAYKFLWMSGADSIADGFVATDLRMATRRAAQSHYRRRSYHLLNHGALGPARKLGKLLRDLRSRIPSGTASLRRRG